ncbi:phage tail protein [Campylobacter sp. FMV-PI01]|uniref:Phage tail protein n=1 Tax=Campylobacter portucalensis TaxID=2608384 RepID=A0A6L5WKG0_9BACT|nr:phage tail protein [Campylobacter portucalensis]MSN96343.1 phage tail protein [Campylobacter portucalensis]
MDIYIARDGDTLDMICFKIYKTLDSDIYALFLRANADILHKDSLDRGDLVNLPNLELKKVDEVKYLWD